MDRLCAHDFPHKVVAGQRRAAVPSGPLSSEGAAAGLAAVRADGLDAEGGVQAGVPVPEREEQVVAPVLVDLAAHVAAGALAAGDALPLHLAADREGHGHVCAAAAAFGLERRPKGAVHLQTEPFVGKACHWSEASMRTSGSSAGSGAPGRVRRAESVGVWGSEGGGEEGVWGSEGQWRARRSP